MKSFSTLLCLLVLACALIFSQSLRMRAKKEDGGSPAPAAAETVNPAPTSLQDDHATPAPQVHDRNLNSDRSSPAPDLKGPAPSDTDSPGGSNNPAPVAHPVRTVPLHFRTHKVPKTNCCIAFLWTGFGCISVVRYAFTPPRNGP